LRRSAAILSEVKQHRQDANLMNIQRRDPDSVAIAYTAKFCCVYHIPVGETQWQKFGIEGPMFVVARSTYPPCRIVVLNRLEARRDFEFDVGAQTLLESSNTTFLALRTDGVTSQVFGLWFHDASEGAQVADTIRVFMYASI
jgi:hypothetical protein